MSKLSKDLNITPIYNNNDSKILGEGICVEYIICINDLGFGSIINDSRTRAVTRKTNCHIEVTPRILNKRVNLYRWIKYAIIKITGPDDASLNQCMRLLEKHFPIFHHRKEYSRRANVTLFTNEIQFPDNTTAGHLIRSGSTMSTCQGLALRSPYDADYRNVVHEMPWKLLKSEKRGRYFSSTLCENASQPSIPPGITSRNLYNNARIGSSNYELDRKKVDKNKLFGSMGTLSTGGVSGPENLSVKLNDENVQKEAKGSQTISDHLDGRNTDPNRHIENGKEIEVDLARRNTDSTKFKLNKSGSLVHKPLSESTKSDPMLAKAENMSEGKSDGKIQLNPLNEDRILTTISHENILFNHGNKRNSQASISRKLISEVKIDFIGSHSNQVAMRSDSINNNFICQNIIDKNVPVKRVSENVSLTYDHVDMQNNRSTVPKGTKNEVKFGDRIKKNTRLTNTNLNSMETLPNSITHSKTISHTDELSLSLSENEKKINSDKVLMNPQKNGMVNAKVSLSYASSRSLTNNVDKIKPINTLADEKTKTIIIKNNDSNSKTNIKIPNLSTPVRVVIKNFDEDNIDGESKSHLLSQSKITIETREDGLYQKSKLNSSPIYNTSQFVGPNYYNQIKNIGLERRYNRDQAVSKSTDETINQLPDFSTNIVTDKMINSNNILVNDIKLETAKNSKMSRKPIPPKHTENIICAEEEINVQPVSGVSKNIVASQSSIETPNGYYVDGINRSIDLNKDSMNRVIDIKRDINIIKLISDKLRNPTEGSLIVMFDGLDIFTTGQMSMVFKRTNLCQNQLEIDSKIIVFESSDYVITAQCRTGLSVNTDITKACHNVTQIDQTLKPKTVK